MPLAEDQDVIQAVAAERSDQALHIWILPGRSRRDRPVANTHGADPILEDLSVGTIIAAHQIDRR
jgi:hypothetical protein